MHQQEPEGPGLRVHQQGRRDRAQGRRGPGLPQEEGGVGGRAHGGWFADHVHLPMHFSCEVLAGSDVLERLESVSRLF